MTYQPKDLSVLAYANGFTLWHYTTVDTSVTAQTSGYFNDACDMFRVGDMIFANLDTEAVTPRADLLFVSEISAGNVTVASMIPTPGVNAQAAE